MFLCMSITKSLIISHKITHQRVIRVYRYLIILHFICINLIVIYEVLTPKLLKN